MVFFAPILVLAQEHGMSVIEKSLGKNNDILKAVSDVEIAEATVEKTYSMFDLKLDGGVMYSKIIADGGASPLLPSADETSVWGYNLSLSRKMETAGILSLDFESSATDLIVPGYNIDPIHAPELALVYQQPLMKGFLGRPDLVGIEIGDLSIALAKENLVYTIEGQVDQLSSALINIAMSRALLETQQRSLDSNERYYTQAVRMKKIGLREEKDLMQTKAAMLNAKSQITPAKNNIQAALDAFESMAGIPVDESDVKAFMDSKLQMVAYEKLNIKSVLTKEDEDALVNQQPAVKIAALSIEMAKLSKTISENSAWPELSAFAKYGITGSEDSEGASYTEMVSNDYPSYSFGLNFTLYLPNRSSSGDVKSKISELKKSEESYNALLKMTRMQIRSAHRALLAAKEDLQLKREIRTAYKRSMDIHTRHFSQGRISARELLLAESDLYRATLSEVQAFYQFEREINNWKKISGHYHHYSQVFIKE